ncbi:aromatic di-alanine and TPR containing protein [Rhizoctonia solani 123E]|uniref:Aromatic di-alanine and TPR containing protein n=1 Tax=Rhizoctonia solani 123E TaxID=1423351 RepID=A0A074SAP8_9AGAM|nr:aromatic di-alanine and TPR containing protein [Rhizoctonia solani 123E]
MSAELGSRSASIGYDETLKREDVHKASEKGPKLEQTEELRVDTNDCKSAKDLNALGWSHLEQFRHNGSLSRLEQSIECFSRAIILTPGGPPDMSCRYANLGVSYTDRYRRLGDLADLEKAMECYAHGVALTPDGHPDISDRHADLGVSYNDRSRRLGELADMEKAIGCFTRALALTPVGHYNMSGRYACLGASYTDRYQCLGDLADLEKAMECYAHGVALTPGGHPNMSRRHAELGASYGHRYQRLGELEVLEKAIECFTRALALTPSGHPDMSYRHAELGVSYTDRYRRLGELADLEKAIEYHTRALALTPDGHPGMPERHASLGISYGDRFRRLGNLADLEKAVKYKTRALVLTPEGHPDMLRRHAELGLAYTDRYRRLGELPDLEKAIKCHTRALESTPDGHPNMSHRHAELGVSYSDRYRRLRELSDLEKAIECFTRALALTPDGYPDMSHRHAYLGVSYTDRYQGLGEVADLERSIEYYTRALALTPDGHPNMSHRHACLGASYTHRYQRLGYIVDLEKSFEYHTRALALIPDDHPDFPRQHLSYALSLLDQYNHTGNLVYLTDSLHSFRMASQHFSGAPRENFQHALHWANLAIKQSVLNPIEAYQTAVDLLPQFIWLGATTSQRYQDLLLTDNLAVKACYAAIQSSNYSLALEWLEHARCVVWNQSMMLRSPLDQLHSSYPDLATRLESISSQLHTHSFDTQQVQPAKSDSLTPEQVGQQRRHLAAEYHNLLSHTRELPGFEKFLQPLKADRLISAVRNGPVVILNCHTDSCDALVIMPKHDQVAYLPLPRFEEHKARLACSQLVESLGKKGQRQRGVKRRDEPSYEEGFVSVLGTLWSDIVQPVLSHLGFLGNTPRDHLPHITWCPTGLLTFLPLHAAGDYSQPQSRIYNYAISSYTPTLTALLASTPSQLNRSCQVLAIGQATTPGLSRLPGTTKELVHVQAHTHNKADYTQLMTARQLPQPFLMQWNTTTGSIWLATPVRTSGIQSRAAFTCMTALSTCLLSTDGRSRTRVSHFSLPARPRPVTRTCLTKQFILHPAC